MIPQKKQYSHCLCECDCGNTVIKSSYQLRHAKQTPSCGCNVTEILRLRAKDATGMKFGRLTVQKSYYSESGVALLDCVCDCGNNKVIRKYDLLSGHTKSCGCLQKEIQSKNMQKDDSGIISDFGVKIIKPYKKNDKGQMIWECECGFCGNHFYDLPARVKGNHVRSCGCLIRSSMEKYISNFLDSIGVDYLSQYSFDDCKSKNGNCLRFDFALLRCGEVFCLLEYDGKQHFESVDYFGGEEDFAIRKERDQIKNKYCDDNDVSLLRLPYYLSNDEIKEKILNILNP